jgi:hypothetical protein
MQVEGLAWIFIGLCALLANIPFLTRRIFWLGPRPERKALGWRFAEWAVLCAAAVALGRAVEAHQGQVYAQGWEFYAAFGCLFATLAFPGFVWTYLRRSAPAAQ